ITAKFTIEDFKVQGSTANGNVRATFRYILERRADVAVGGAALDLEVFDREFRGNLIPFPEERLPPAAFVLGQPGVEHANVGNALARQCAPQIAEQHVDRAARVRRLSARGRDPRVDAD